MNQPFNSSETIKGTIFLDVNNAITAQQPENQVKWYFSQMIKKRIRPESIDSISVQRYEKIPAIYYFTITSEQLQDETRKLIPRNSYVTYAYLPQNGYYMLAIIDHRAPADAGMQLFMAILPTLRLEPAPDFVDPNAKKKE